MIKRLFATFVATAFAFALGIFAFSATEVEAQEDYSGHTAVLGIAEYITDPESGEAGGVIIYSDAALEVLQRDSGNGQLAHDFVYNDPRASWDAVADISFGIKTGNTSADVNLTNQIFWMRESFRIWERTNCSSLRLIENQVNPLTLA